MLQQQLAIAMAEATKAAAAIKEASSSVAETQLDIEGSTEATRLTKSIQRCDLI